MPIRPRTAACARAAPRGVSPGMKIQFLVKRFRIDESQGSPGGVLYDPPQFTRFDGLMQVDLCAERFGSLRPGSGQEVFEGSELVFEAVEGTWSVLEPWSV